jgi:amino acid adenylation domain-containing protein
MSRKNVEDIYPLSPMQQGMLFHTLYADEPGVYFVSHWLTLEGRLDGDAFQRALQEVVNRHAVLRTAFLWERREEPLQVVRERVRVPLSTHDLSAFSPEEQAEHIRRLREEDRRRGFDPTRPPLLRAALVKLDAERHGLLLSLHHLLLDGWSLPIVLDELFRLYAANAEGRALRLDRPRPYGDYIAWLKKQDPARTAAFWRSRLAGFHAKTPLGVDRPPHLGRGPAHFAELRRTLSAEDSEHILAFSRRHPITVSTLLQGAFALLLSHYSGEDDVLFGATVSGRSLPLPGIESMVGLFINTLPSRVQIDHDARAGDFLLALQRSLNELRDVEHSALVDAQAESDVPRGSPLFESLLVFENYPFDEALYRRSGGLSVVEQSTQEHTNYPLTVVGALRDRMFLRLSYDARRFDAPTIQRMMGHLRNLLVGLARGSARRLAEISPLDEEERLSLLVGPNQTDTPAPEEPCVHLLFERWAFATPDAIAVEAGDERWSYEAIASASHRLAHHLRSLGVGPETLVGVCLRRSPALVIALLAVLHAGGAYVPLDPELPVDRLAFLLEDAGPLVLLSEEALLARLPATSAAVVCVDRDRARYEEEPATAPLSGVAGHHPAYVIYTSGSTGRPKGVVLLHEGVVNYLAWARANYPSSEGRGAPVHSSIGFDLTVTSLFVPLVSGRTVTLIPDEQGALGLSSALRGAPAFSLVKLTPPHLELLAQTLPPEDFAGATRAFVLGGEALSFEQLAFVQKHAPSTRLINEYGPTETVVGCSVYEVPEGGLQRGPVPIGRPIANTRLYVLDARMEPVPIGVAGELFIGGVQVGRGYWKRPALTAERFVPDPFSERPEARLYRSGDRVRRLASGDLEFLGRIDFQVKIRGHRVELGEVESVLARAAGVREVVVTVREDLPGDKRLVAYLVTGDGFAGADAIKRLARRELPEVMIPSAIVSLDALPLTKNGKIDRRALPAPEASAWASLLVEPRGPVEQAIAAIFAEVLHLPAGSVGARSSFFELGGHSLLATSAMSRITSAFAVALPLRALFEAPTPEALGARVEAELRGGPAEVSAPIVAAPTNSERPLSFAEERLWFLHQLDPDDPSYGISLGLRLEGRLDASALERALAEIVHRHALLRTTFPAREGKPFARIGADPWPALAREDHLDLPPDARQAQLDAMGSAEARRPFDLARGPLFRATLLRFSEADHALLLHLHHILSDAWTLGLLQRELAVLYGAFLRGEPSPLPAPSIDYADYAAWQRATSHGEAFARDLSYFQEQLQGARFVLDLPADRPPPAEPTHRGGRASFDLSPALSRALRDLSRREGTTLFMTLLAAFVAWLHRLSGQVDFTVGTPVANRSRPELEPVLGLFLDTLVLRARPTPELGFRALLAQIKATCLGAYAHASVPFERLVETLATERDPGRSPLFQVMFTLESASSSSSVELPGLRLSRVAVPNETSKFELTLALVERESGLHGLFEYSRDRFEPDTIARRVESFRTLLAGLVKAPDQPLSSLPLLPEGERTTLLAEWNATAAEAPEEATFGELFEAQVERTPDAPALVFQGETLSYDALARRARRLARHLRRLGVGPETRVGLCLPRSLDLVIGLLGILEAGGAYVPLDPTYPRERLAFMLADAELGLLVSERALADTLPPSDATQVLLDRDRAAIEREDEAPLPPSATAENAAYVIYTSGSSGQPKGRGGGAPRPWKCGRGAPSCLWGGAGEPGAPVLLDQLRCVGVGALHGAPHRRGAGAGAQRGLVAGARAALHAARASDHGVDGAPVDPRGAARGLAARAPDLGGGGRGVLGGAGPSLGGRRHFWNAYGPTETTICASMGECLAGEGKPSIGRPIANMRVLVLDEQQNLQPIGVPGELCIGGVGLARGYLKRPELSNERFIEDPFGREGGCTAAGTARGGERMGRWSTWAGSMIR